MLWYAYMCRDLIVSGSCNAAIAEHTSKLSSKHSLADQGCQLETTSCKLGVQPMLSSNRNDGEGEPPSKSLPVGDRGAAPTSVLESGRSTCWPISTDRCMECSMLLSYFRTPALGRLIRSEFSLDELPSLVATFAREDASDKILSLGKDDAQAFIDVIDEVHTFWTYLAEYSPPNSLIIDQVLDKLDLPLESRKICLKQLYRTCGYHELLPKALKAPIWYDRSGSAKYHGGYADVWKGECRGREVAVKVIRTCSKSNLQRVVGVSYILRSPSTYLKADSAPRRGSTRRS